MPFLPVFGNFQVLKILEAGKNFYSLCIQLCLIILNHFIAFGNCHGSKIPKIGHFHLFLAFFGYQKFWNPAETSIAYVIQLCLMIRNHFIAFCNCLGSKIPKICHFWPKKCFFGGRGPKFRPKMVYPFSTPFLGPMCKKLELGFFFFFFEAFFPSVLLTDV